MGVGKTTLGRELASRLGRPFLDSDTELEMDHGTTGANIASSDGVDRLHALELEIFSDMVGSEPPSVIAPAASVVDTQRGRSLLTRTLTIWLDAPDEVLAVRRGADDHRRDVGDDEATELERRRRPYWRDLAVTRVDTSGSVMEAVDMLVSELRRVEAG